MNGLVVHEIERFVAARGADDLVIARLSIEILGVLPMDEFDMHIEVVRPGRTIELLEATVTAAGRPAVRTRVWRLAPFDTADVAGGAPEPLPDPSTVNAVSLSDVWPGGYIKTIDVRRITPHAPGRAVVWLSTDIELVAGENASDLARYAALLDTANGIAVRESVDEWLFPNVEMSVHFYRQPVGRMLGLDTTVIFGPGGQGLTSSVVHDVEGPVGTAQQGLTIRPR